MIQLKKNCELILVDENIRDEEIELVDVLSLKDDILCGVFEVVTSFSDVFYDDNEQEEINFTVRVKVQIKATVDLNYLSVKDHSLLKFDILNINAQRTDILKYVEDLVSDYYSLQYKEYTINCVLTARLIEKGFEL